MNIIRRSRFTGRQWQNRKLNMADARLNIRVDAEAEEFQSLARQSERASKQMVKGVQKVNAELERQERALKSTVSNTARMDKAVSGANQTLFSFGDIINDAQQFQFGFSQGSRAIGNNIAFMSEQFTNVSRNAGGFTGALKAMGTSLLGPGGVILAINLVITGITLLSGAFERARKEAKKLNEEELDDLTKNIGKLADELAKRGFFGEDPFGIAQLEFERQRLLSGLREIERAQTTIFNQQKQARLDELEALKFQAEFMGTQLNPELKNELFFLRASKNQASLLQGQQDQIKKDLSDINEELRSQRDLQKEVTDLTRPRIEGIDPAGLTGGISVTGAAAELEFQQQEELFKQLGTTRLEFLQNIADKEIQLKKKTEDAKTAIEILEERNRQQLQAQAIQTASALIGAAFGKNKAAAIATTLIETFASAQAAFRSQLLPGDPTSVGRAIAAAALATAQGLARVATMRSITPENPQAGGGTADGGRPVGPDRSTRNRFADISPRQQIPAPQPIIIQGDINTVAAAFKIREGEAVIRKRGVG